MVAEGLGNLAALRTFRVLRALKTVAIIPGKPTVFSMQQYTVLLKMVVTFYRFRKLMFVRATDVYRVLALQD